MITRKIIFKVVSPILLLLNLMAFCGVPEPDVKEIVFISNSVENYNVLIPEESDGVLQVIIDAKLDGIGQINHTLAQYRNVHVIHIISHGFQAGLDLGSGKITLDNIANYAEGLKLLGKALTNSGDIVLYGCNIAKGSLGESFIAEMSKLTGADIAASNDLTGNSTLGGNWVLETGVGLLNYTSCISESARNAFKGTLVTNGTSDGTYDFGSLGGEGTGGTGYKKQGDKFVVSNDFLGAGTIIYLQNYIDGVKNITTSTVEWKAEGTTVMKTFTFEDMGIGSFTSNTTINQFVVTVKNISGGTIATHTFNGTQVIGTASTFSISSFAFSSSWPSGGYDNVAEIEITYTTSEATNNFEFRTINLSNISNSAVVNAAPTASSFTASPIYEGTAYGFSTANFSYSDSDGDPIDHLRVTAVPANGSLWVDSDGSGTINGGESALTNNGTISKVDLDANKLKYLNANGTSSSFTFDVNDGTDYSSSTYTATLTVTPEPSVTLSLDPSSSVAENGGTTNVKATLSNSFNKTVTVNLSKSGTSSAGDFTLASTSISINSGSTSGTSLITGQNDALDEENETIILDISSVTNGSESSTQQVTCTITDDDDPPTVSFTAATQSSANETGTMTVTAQLSAESGKTVSVPFSINVASTATGSGTDYSISSSPVTINAGSTSANITITIATDNKDEDNETVIINMGTPVNATVGATSTHTATITDDDATPSVSFTAATQSSANETGTMTVTAQLSAESGKTVSVPFSVNGASTATGSGTDYSVSSSPVTINAGSTSANITITIATDNKDEDNETVIINMGTPVNATVGATTAHTATITDDDNPPSVSFTAAMQSSANETGTMTVTAQLSAESGKTVSVPFSVNGASTATGSGTDYSVSSSPVTINAGSTSANITITIATDNKDEDNETVIINMGTPVNATVGATSTHTATITDDDATPSVSFTAATQSSANETGTMTITAQLSAESGRSVSIPFSVNGASTATGSGTDYSITSSPLTINAGSTSANITVTIAADNIDEDNETVIINMGTPVNATVGATSTHTATITDDDATPSVSFTAATQSSANETGAMTVTAQLSATSGKTVTVPFSVNVASTATGSGTDYSITSSPLTISAGNPSADITITITSESLDEDNETVIIDMGTPTNASRGATTSHTATITDDDNTPVITASQNFTINEDRTGAIGSVVATDDDAGTTFQSFTITANVNADGDGNNAFSISPSNGQLTVNDVDDLDREKNDVLKIKLTVSDGTNTSLEEEVVININDVNDITPVITGGQSFFVADNTLQGVSFGTVLATDGDVTSTTFSNWAIVTNVNPDLDGNNAFSIEPATGKLKVNDVDDLITGQNHTIGVTCSDGMNTSLEVNVSISVTASNAQPVITSSSTANVNENATTVLTVTATDGDDDPIVFSISDGDDKAFFEITPNGVLSFKSGPDYDVPADLDLDNVYEVEVTAADNKGGSDKMDISVTVKDLNEAPIITNQTLSLDENPIEGAEIGTVTATEQDFGQTISFELLGANSGLFTIGGSDGKLGVKDSTGFDFETSPSLDITVKVTDDNVSPLSAEATITVNLRDINELPLVSNQTFSINENSIKGAAVGSVTASDPEELTLSYILKPGSGTTFTIDPETGAITVNDSSKLDFEVNTSFSFDISVADTSLSTDAQITVNVVNINDNAPQLLKDTFEIAENANANQVIDTLKFFDADGEVGTYSILITSGNEDGIVEVDPITREVTVLKPELLDYETKQSYSLELKLSDGIHVVDTSLTIKIIDIPGDGVSTPIAAGFKIYPVPASNTLFISTIDGHAIRTIEIVSINGQLIQSVHGIYQNEYKVDVSGISQGNYLLLIKTDKVEHSSVISIE